MVKTSDIVFADGADNFPDAVDNKDETDAVIVVNCCPSNVDFNFVDLAEAVFLDSEIVVLEAENNENARNRNKESTLNQSRN